MFSRWSGRKPSSRDVFSEVTAYILALADVRLAPGGDKLSYPTARFCAELILSMPDPSMPDPQVQTPTEFEIENFLRNYHNPRKMPKRWLVAYLTRPKPQLAIDVLRAFDTHYQLEEKMKWLRLKVWILGGALAASWAVLLVLFEKVL